MSSKKTQSYPGLKQIVRKTPKPTPSLAVRVTGRNLAGVTYLVSLAAERRGESQSVKASFAHDGSLVEVLVSTQDAGISLLPGDYVYLHPLDSQITYSAQSHYVATYEELP